MDHPVTRCLILTILAALPVISLFASDEDTLPPTVGLPPELARVLSDYEQGWQQGDAAALASLFTEDGFVLSGGHPPIRGRDSIESHYTGKGGPLALRAFAFATAGDVGYILGGYAAKRGQPDGGKFTLTLQRTETGRWLIVSDMDSPNSR